MGRSFNVVQVIDTQYSNTFYDTDKFIYPLQ